MSAIKLLFNLIHPLGIVKMFTLWGGGGGGGGGSTGTQTQISELPEWARPYAKNTLEKTAALTETPYQQYNAPRIAGFSPMQQQAQENAANMQTSGLTGLGGQIAGAAALGGLNQQYDPMMARSQNFGMGAAQRYMNPYAMSALEPTLQEQARQSAIQGQGLQAKAVGQGAFGGSRQALEQAENARNLGMLQNKTISEGMNTAYNNAMNQFNADQARNMQAQQMNIGQQQFGANLGLQGLNTALQGASQLGALGGQEFQQGMDINKLQNAYGAQQQALRQQGLDLAYQDFQNQQNYPYKQLGFMSDMIRGLPLGQQSTTQMYQSPGSLLGQAAGLGVGALGMSSLYNTAQKAGAGFAEGGSVESEGNIQSIVSKLSDQQLQQAMQAAQARGDADQIDAIQKEMAMRASERGGMAGAFNSLPQESQDTMMQMAGGGVVAFADEGLVKGEPVPEKATSKLGDFLSAIGVSDAVNALREYNAKTSERDRQISAAEDLYPGLTGSVTPTERKRRTEAADRLMVGDQPVQKLSQAELAEKQREFRAQAAPQDSPYASTSTESFLADMAAGKPSEGGKSSGKGTGGISDHPVVRRASEIAQAAGVPKETFADTVKNLMKDASNMGAEERAEMKRLNQAALDRVAAMQQRAAAQALTAYGFDWAQRASKPGARFVGSAAEASPTIAKSLSESDRLIQAAQDNADKTRMDQLRFDQSMKHGNLQLALQQAGLLEQDKKNEQMLELKKQELAMMSKYHGQAGISNLGKMVNDMAQRDPEFAKLPGQQQFQIAAKLSGYGSIYRSDAGNQARMAEGIRKINEKYAMLGMLPAGSDLAKTMAAKREQDLADFKAGFSLSDDSLGGAPAQSGNNYAGFKLVN